MKNITYYLGLTVFVIAICTPLFNENYGKWELLLITVGSIGFIYILWKLEFFKRIKKTREQANGDEL